VVITPPNIVLANVLARRYLAERCVEQIIFLFRMLSEFLDKLSIYVIKYGISSAIF
jgi:hypothetical protein